MLRHLPIRQKLMTIILLTSGVVMALMCAVFFIHEYLTFRSVTLRQLSTMGEITADNTTAALVFEDARDAKEILSALRAEKNVVAAALYHPDGRLFVRYPESLAIEALPAQPGADGYRFGKSQLAGFQPVVQRDTRVGTLYLKFNTGVVIREWIVGSLKLALVAIAVILGIAFLLSRALQKQISLPILGLAETARAISERHDYSVRAPKLGNDELGLLTEAFNQMLAQIQQLNRDLEQRVAERTAQLEGTNKELEAFSYSVSHDLRAPLRHIDGFTNLLLKHSAASLDEKSRRYLATISGAAVQMGRLIDDLLAFSRTGRAPLGLGDVDHDALVAEVLREGRYGTEKPIDWQIGPLPAVHADAALLRQVWVNLIDNAVKYSGKNPGPRIAIGHQPASASQPAAFFIRDNGVGFDMKYADKLFGVFQRLHSTAEFPGTGIGLANVHRIIARHGGRIWAESRVGEGTTFYFSLPEIPLAPTPADASSPPLFRNPKPSSHDPPHPSG